MTPAGVEQPHKFLNSNAVRSVFRMYRTAFGRCEPSDFCSTDVIRSLPTPADLEWKMIYVGSAESEQYDQALNLHCILRAAQLAASASSAAVISVHLVQELESVLVGPVEMGINRFIFQAPLCHPCHYESTSRLPLAPRVDHSVLVCRNQ